jgi:hypothetical protein
MSGGPGAAAGSRGQPLLVFGLVCGGWLALRVLLWQSPFALPRQPALSPPAPLPLAPSRAGRPDRAFPGAIPGNPPAPIPGVNDAPVSEPLPPPWLQRNLSALAPTSVQRLPAREIVGQQLLLAAAFAHMEIPPEAAARRAGPPPDTLAAGTPSDSAPAIGRWSGDAWLLVRNGSSGPLTLGTPAYGRSQAGAVLRYRLAPASGHRPAVYARVTRALAGSRETEVAAGLSARPLAGLPVSVAGEMRVREGPAGREVRPAAFAVTELPPANLPRGLRAEGYLQAGYVGGHFATAFIDGQARIDAPVVRLAADTPVRVGGGVWGGAQKHAARLDVGPSAAVDFRLGDTLSRVALDYRVRVAGDAEPKSGPALTISAGF